MSGVVAFAPIGFQGEHKRVPIGTQGKGSGPFSGWHQPCDGYGDISRVAMPRRLRRTLQGAVFHVMNRAVRGTVLFRTKADYRAFVAATCESLSRFRIRVIAYCVMPNHWHFVVICDRIEDLSRWMHWLCCTHANRWNGAHATRGRGAVYQAR